MGLSPTCEDGALAGVADDDVRRREGDRVPRVIEGANAKERLAEAWHDVPGARELAGEVGDAVATNGRGDLVLPCCCANEDGGGRGVHMGQGRGGAVVDARGAGVDRSEIRWLGRGGATDRGRK